MAERFLLERAKQEVELENGRVFLLQEMSGPELREYLRLQLDADQKALDEIAERGLGVENGSNGGDAFLHAYDIMLKHAGPLFLFMLQRPADGKAPADQETLDSLGMPMKKALLKKQEALNDTEAIAGNVASLLGRAQARRKVGEMVSVGPN